MVSERAEVVIVGGGIVGASVAWWLSRDVDVLVLEQSAHCGAEASAQNAGMVRRLVHHPVELALADRSARMMAEEHPDWALAASRVTGAVLAVGREGPEADALDAAAAALRGRGVPVEAASGAALAEAAPALAGAPVARAWVMPEERVADGHALVQGFLRGARRGRGRLMRERRVSGIVVEGGRAVGVETDGGRILADAVVLATGAWSRRFAAEHGLDRPLVPLARHLLFSDPHPLHRPEHPWCWIDDVGVYVRPEGGGWLCSPCDEATLEPAAGPGSAAPIEPLGRALAADKLGRWFPALPAAGDVRFARGWRGLRTFAPDRLPYLGPDPEVAGVWWASGLGGSGVTCCFSAGELVADLLRGRSPDWIDPAAVAPGRVIRGPWPDWAGPRSPAASRRT